jgi:uncharacterized protein (TIGR00251 family)
MTNRGTRGVEESAFWQEGQDALLRVYAKPRASKSRFVRVSDAEVHVALSAPPVDGEANKELLKFLSGSLDIPKSQLLLEKGDASRHKLVRFRAMNAQTMERLIEALISD